MPTGTRPRVLASKATKSNSTKDNAVEQVVTASSSSPVSRRSPKEGQHTNSKRPKKQNQNAPSVVSASKREHRPMAKRPNMYGLGREWQSIYSPGVRMLEGHLPVDPMGYQWRAWPHLKVMVKLTHHHRQVEVRDLFEVFSQFGFIGRIEANLGHEADAANGFAIISFIPPPAEPFWLIGTVQVNGIARPLQVGLLRHKTATILSPLDAEIAYPSFSNVYAEELAFGVMTGENTMMQMLTLRSYTGTDILMQLNLKKKELDIRFQFPPTAVGDLADLGRFRVPFRELKEALCVDMGAHYAFCFTLSAPPEFFKQLDGRDIAFDSNPWNEWSSWTRQTELVDPKFAKDHQRSPLRMRVEHAVIDYGRWLTYRFIVGKSKQFAQMLKILVDFNVRIKHLKASEFTFLARKDADIWRHLELSSAHPSIKVHGGKEQRSYSGVAEMESGISHLPFPVLWQLMVCISRGYLNEYNMTREFLQKLNDLGQQRAQGLLERIADCKLRFHDPMKIFSQVKASPKSKRVPSYCSLLYACCITPTTVLFSSPVVEISNRVIRKNSEYQDRFLRVRFTEENIGRIHSQRDSVNEELFVRIRRFLKYGLVLGDRHYEFLAFGNSQFREHGLCAFASIKGLAEIPDMTANDIRSQLGNFDHIRVPAKWCARLGQNFSTTRAFPTAVTVKGSIPDIERNGYSFTDGVGKMSSFVASMVGMEFGRASDNPPSVVQFRLGGSKGILAMSPELLSREVHIRDSQFKFESQNTGLEIIRISQFVSATLNRQLIVLLSSLGLSDDIFTGMLKNMLRDLETAMVDKHVACRILTKHVDFNHMTLTMTRMILDGFMDCQEPFMMSLLRLWRSWLIKHLKDKARIFIDKGACLFGAVDEYAVLKGHFEAKKPTTREETIRALPEVFVQIDAERNGQYRVLNEICMIARNPSLHPGDIRIVRAVDKPELRHIKDVLILPQTGDRDLGSMCSGGDLDGDDYLVIWDQSMLPPMEEWNHPAMDFSPQLPRPLSRPVTVEDISDFFIQYIKNDHLPTIALAHLCWADTMEEGVKNPKCLQLAILHSHAVDYPKNGEPAQMTKDLRPHRWPHFMESDHRSEDQIYRSKAILGQIFDMIDRIDFTPALDKAFDSRILDAFHVPTAMLGKAKDIKTEYDTAIRRIMAQLNIATEFEVFTAFVMSANREKKDFTLAEELGAITQAHKNRFREMCAEAAGGRTYNDLGPFLVAMYRITQCEVIASTADMLVPSLHTFQADSLDQLPLISFPWIFATELGNIATGRYRSEDIISVMMTAQLHNSRPRRKQAQSTKYAEFGPLVDLSEQLDIPIIDGSAQSNHPSTNSDLLGDDIPDYDPGIASVTPPTYCTAEELDSLFATSIMGKSIVPLSAAIARTNNRLTTASISRSESPMSLHPSESTARESTPPSSQGGQEEPDDLYDDEEDRYDAEEDMVVEGGLTKQLAALLGT